MIAQEDAATKFNECLFDILLNKVRNGTDMNETLKMANGSLSFP